MDPEFQQPFLFLARQLFPTLAVMDTGPQILVFMAWSEECSMAATFDKN